MENKVSNPKIIIFLLLIIIFFNGIYLLNINENKVNKKILNENNIVKIQDKNKYIENSDYNIPIYFKGFKSISYLSYYYYTILNDYNKDYDLFKITDNKNFMFNIKNDIEISYHINVITQFNYDKNFYFRTSKYKRYYLDIGIKEIPNKNEEINCFSYFIMWSHKKNPKHEINENTDTIITNLEFKTIQRMYPKFKGKYVKSQVQKILISNKISFVYYYAFLNNIIFYGDKYIENMPLYYMKKFVMEADRIIDSVNNKKYSEYTNKYRKLEDFIEKPDTNDLKGSKRYIEKIPIEM